jgi:protein subunit release factor A
MINPEDLKIETLPIQPISGMMVGNIGSGVRITHLPTGFIVGSMKERSQHKNKEKALEHLEFLLEFFGDKQ